MELQFNGQELRCFDPLSLQSQTRELTQEIRLSDGMPDAGRVVGCRAQAILRGKEWRTDSICVTGGLMIWVLYAPEDGTQVRWVDSWVPFQMKWDIPKSDTDGILRVVCSPAFADARIVSAKKLMVRGGVTAAVQAWIPRKMDIFTPAQVPEDVQLLKNTYPVRLIQEAGEKAFQIDEELPLNAGSPPIDKLVSYDICPVGTDAEVSADKVIFRGDLRVKVLYSTEEGQLCSSEMLHPYSQLVRLEKLFGPDAQADVLPAVTSSELDVQENGALALKCGLVGQYLVDDVHPLELVEDAYSPVREISRMTASVQLPTVLEKKRVEIPYTQTADRETKSVVDFQSFIQQPRVSKMANGISLEMAAQTGILYRSPEDTLTGIAPKWEGNSELEADGDCRVLPMAYSEQEPHISVGADQLDITGTYTMGLLWVSGQEMTMVTGLEAGALQEPDPSRPSLILRRMGEQSLWELAKESGSTVDAICKANGLEGEPEDNRMLLIPVG